jgi:hypothetical protein
MQIPAKRTSYLYMEMRAKSNDNRKTGQWHRQMNGIFVSRYKIASRSRVDGLTVHGSWLKHL